MLIDRPCLSGLPLRDTPSVEHFWTTRLVVRDWTTADVEACFAIYSRPEVARWTSATPSRPVASLEEMLQMLERRTQRSHEYSYYGMWAVQLRDTGQVVGSALLRPVRNSPSDVEVGWHLNPSYWGFGYATEVGRGLIALAFGLDHVGRERVGPEVAARRTRPVLDRVKAFVEPDNVRSKAVCHRLAMTHLGQVLHDGTVLEVFEVARSALGEPAATATPTK